MIYFLPNNPETLALLIAGQQLLRDPDRWWKGSMKQGQSYFINGALFEVGNPNYKMPDDYVSNDPLSQAYVAVRKGCADQILTLH